MIHSARKQTKSNVIFHFSRPVRVLMRRSSLAAIVILAVVTVFVSKVDSPFTRSVRVAIADTMSPVMRVLSVPVEVVAGWHADMSEYFFVHDKNKALTQENVRLAQQLISLSQVAVENERLKDLLGFVDDVNYSYVSARVVGDVSGPFIRSILINAGQSGHVRKGQAVVGENGLVGRIIEVGEQSSRILLITDINSRIPVITSISRERSILAGNNTGNPDLIYLHEDNQVKEGEVVVTSGDGGLFPPDLLVGKVRVASDGSFSVQPFMQWHRLEHLSVLNYGTSVAVGNVPLVVTP